MAEKTATQTFPRRDDDGRIISLKELLFATVAGFVVGMVAVVIIDAVVALLDLARFGSASGWLALILPGLLFFDDLRAWKGHGVRILVAIVAAAVSIGLGLIGASLVGDVPAIVSGGVGALVAAIIYAFVWFVSIRWLTGHHVEMRS